MATITELDLRTACHPSTIVDRIHAVPVLKTSTAFFTFLRANLVLPQSAMASNAPSPYLEPQAPPPQSMTTGGSASASRGPATTASTTANLDDIPPLSLDILTKHDDKVDALHLIADSIAQQRQQASLNIVFHPLPLAALALALGIAYQWARVFHNNDLGITMTVCSGVVMTYLMTIRMFSVGYLQVAENLKWEWLDSADGSDEQDLVLGTRFGDEMIGALVLRLEANPALAGKKKSRGLALKGGRGIIRAWTTKLRYRKKGVGQDLLHEAVRITRERCGKDAEIGFAQEHANSVMILPEMFNRSFRKREMKAAKALESVLAEWEGTRRKR